MGLFDIKPRLKDKDLSTKKPYFVPLESDYVKFELEAEEPNINGGKVLGMRVWINLQSPISVKQKKGFALPIKRIKTPIVDTFEILPEGYNLLFKYLMENEDIYTKHKYHTTYSKLKKEMKKTMDSSNKVRDFKKILWTVGRVKLFESKENFNSLQQEIQIKKQLEEINNQLSLVDKMSDEEKSQYSVKINELIQQRDQLKNNLNPIFKKFNSEILEYIYNKIVGSEKLFFEPKSNILTSLYDFSDIPFDLKKLSNSEISDINEILKGMYLEEEQEDFIRKYCHFESFKKGKMPQNNYSGIILYGPPGTGKTFTVKEALKPIFVKLGFEWIEPRIGDLLGGESSGYVGGFAKPVNDFFMEALESIRNNLKPAFIFIDEGTSLVEKSSRGKANGSDWIGQGVETFKNFLNPELYPGIVLCVSTNLESANFDPTIKDRRLKGVYVGLPNYERASKIWKSLIKNKFGKKVLKSIGEDNIEILAKITENTLSVNTIASSCDIYREILDNNNEKFIFDKFKTFFLNEAKKRCKEEFETSKELLEGDSGAIAYDPKMKEKLEHVKRLYNIQIEKIRRVEEGISDEDVEKNAVKRAFDIASGSLEKEYLEIYNLFKKIYQYLEKDYNHIGSVGFYDGLKMLNNLIPNFLSGINELIEQKNSELINLELAENVKTLLEDFNKFYQNNLEGDFLTPSEISKFILGVIAGIIRVPKEDLFNNNSNNLSLESSQFQVGDISEERIAQLAKNSGFK